jgi:hypothetical protein
MSGYHDMSEKMQTFFTGDPRTSAHFTERKQTGRERERDKYLAVHNFPQVATTPLTEKEYDSLWGDEKSKYSSVMTNNIRTPYDGKIRI